MARRILIAFSIVVFLTSIFLVNWQVDRTDFGFIAVFYSLAFAAYLLIIRFKEEFEFKHLLFIAGAAHLVSMIYEPFLSIDYYRFIWDGEITWAGINPFEHKPQELLNEAFVQNNPYLLEVYEGIGGMSQANYSVYPPVNQGYFILATAFSNSLAVNTFVLKLLIVITEAFGAIYLRKLLIHLKIDPARMWLLYLNPLWIIECTGNTHFEGVMISYLFIALYFLIQKKIIPGASLFAIAVQIKLIPLMLLPFFYRFLGFWKSALFYSITITLVVLLALLQLDADNIHNFANSVRLYFQVFEFNSFILHYYIQYGIAETGWNLTKTYGPQLSKIAIGLIMILALYGQINDWKKLFKRMTIAFFVYLLFSSTLHPWYVLTMLALSLFTNYTFPLLWSFVIFFSYVFYNYNDSSAFEVRTIVNIEYILLLLLFFFEIFKGKTPFKFLRLN